MHKLYEEHYLYEIRNERINAVEQIASSVIFDLGVLTRSIDCGDSSTAKEVFKDVCENLLKDVNFAMIGKFLINLANIKEVKPQENKLIINYTQSGTIVICNSKEEVDSLSQEITNKLAEINKVELNT